LNIGYNYSIANRQTSKTQSPDPKTPKFKSEMQFF
jgi:hypothetical protein